MTEQSCGHNHTEDAPTRFAKYGNLGVGAVGAAVGVATRSPALLADAGHNLGDYFGHKEHLETSEAERHGASETSVAKSRKRAARIIAGVAIGTALYSGYELYQQVNSDERPQIHVVAAAAELGSVGLNLTVRQKYKKQPPSLQGQIHSRAHNNVDLGCSIAAFTGIVLNPVIPGIEGVAGLGVSFVTGRLAQSIYTGTAH